MPDVAANTFLIAFGDLLRAYVLAIKYEASSAQFSALIS